LVVLTHCATVPGATSQTGFASGYVAGAAYRRLLVFAFGWIDPLSLNVMPGGTVEK